LPWLSKLAIWVQHVLLPLGGWGLAAAAVLDSSFVPFPSGVDLWMITLCVNQPARAPFYVLVAALGSVAGSSLLYAVVRKGEEAFLDGKLSAEKVDRVRQRFERYGLWALAGAALLPPPAPFKLFVVAAGLLRYRWVSFALGLFVGRVIRYSLEGYLAVRFGKQAWQLLLGAGPWALAAAAAILIGVLLAVQLRRNDPGGPAH
jgi:membrane protein YqaA with SNARE-associated domain